LEHELAYVGLQSGAIQVTDLYSTDAEIAYYHLRTLKDDLHFFPTYDAVLLYRSDLVRRWPEGVRAMLGLEGKISESNMIEMNEQAKINKTPANMVAAAFLRKEFGVQVQAKKESWVQNVILRTREHLSLVGISLGAAIALSIPLGILAARYSKQGQIILGVVGIIQTVPSLALLVFMIPLLGIGSAPAIVALFLYSLLPIVRNTHSGLQNIPLEIRESAEALGLPTRNRLWRIELPLASPAILSGIKTSAVINVGTATLGALIGAGGYGQPILTGIRLDDIALILEGAIPAAGLALGVQGVFDLAERYFVPKGLRLAPEE
jgi:osmoprotectant transport system permease protein